MSAFSEHDRKLIESLTYDPTLTPNFEALKACLVWADEQVDNLTPAGYETLCDLWVARTILFHDPTRKTLDDDYFRSIWEEVRAQQVKWPGFHRLHLSPQERAFYEQMLKDGGL
jgi:hypothetical protein